MPRLKAAPSRIGSLAPTVGYPPSADSKAFDRHRRKVEPWRNWYKLARWARLRAKVLLRDGYQCAMCSAVESNTANLVADHIKPHRGDPALFWDEANIQTLCKPCHDGPKQRAERSQPTG